MNDDLVAPLAMWLLDNIALRGDLPSYAAFAGAGPLLTTSAINMHLGFQD